MVCIQIVYLFYLYAESEHNLRLLFFKFTGEKVKDYVKQITKIKMEILKYWDWIQRIRIE